MQEVANILESLEELTEAEEDLSESVELLEASISIINPMFDIIKHISDRQVTLALEVREIRKFLGIPSGQDLIDEIEDEILDLPKDIVWDADPSSDQRD